MVNEEKRSLYQCGNARVKGKRIQCAAGHIMTGQGGKSVAVTRLARGEPLVMAGCQGCPDYDEMGPPIPAGERGWVETTVERGRPRSQNRGHGTKVLPSRGKTRLTQGIIADKVGIIGIVDVEQNSKGGKAMATEKTLRIYRQGDATGRLVYDPHGKSTYGYGHRGYEYGFALYVYKGNPDQGYQLAISLPPRVYIAYVKAIVKAVAETPMPAHKPFGYTYWLKGKTWRHPQGGEYPILRG